jgi:hypothetical protein
MDIPFVLQVKITKSVVPDGLYQGVGMTGGSVKKPRGHMMDLYIYI